MATQKLYAYEIPQAALDSFVRENVQPDLVNAYRKLRMMLLAYACVDFGAAAGQDNSQATSWAWEDLHITFTGYGESALTGPVLQMWDCLSPRKQRKLQRVLTRAFAEAEVATDRSVARRYLPPARLAPIRVPSDGYDLPPLIPNWGPSTDVWAEEEGLDPMTVERHMRLIELEARMGLIELRTDETGSVVEIVDVEDPSPQAANSESTRAIRPTRAPHLTLVPDPGADG